MLGHTYNLVADYQQVPCIESAEYLSWKQFVISNAHILANNPELVYQQVE
jgi:hypothetical protein